MIAGMSLADPGTTLPDLIALVTSFEDASIPLDRFHHRQHLMVAAYLSAEQPDTALDRMRAGLRRLLVKHGKDGYHETVTVFWMRALRHRLDAQPASWSTLARVEDAVAWAESARPLDAHYSPERLADPRARQVFLEPDRTPLG
jgi:hypothetical protein